MVLLTENFESAIDRIGKHRPRGHQGVHLQPHTRVIVHSMIYALSGMFVEQNLGSPLVNKQL
jgi:hypothetical protein